MLHLGRAWCSGSRAGCRSRSRAPCRRGLRPGPTSCRRDVDAEAVVRFGPRRSACPASTARARRSPAASTSTRVDTAALASDGSSASMLIVSAAVRRDRLVCAPAGRVSVQERDRRRSRRPGSGSPTRMNVVKNGPVAPSARNHAVAPARHARRFVAAVEEPRRAEIHRALGDDRLPSNVDHDARTTDRPARGSRAADRDARGRRHGRTSSSPASPPSRRNVTVDVVRRRSRIGEQHVRVEEALRAFGEEPRVARRRPTAFPLCAP